MKILPLPSKARLDELLVFNPDTGIITWIVSQGRCKAGDIAGTIWTQPKSGNKYRQIKIDGIKYWAHRLARFYYYGDQPIEVDHANGNSLDNRKENLRASNRKHNTNNCKMPKTNTSGIIGVSYNKRMKLWRAEYGNKEFIKKHGTRKLFKTFEAAVAQRKLWEDQYDMTELKKHRRTDVT